MGVQYRMPGGIFGPEREAGKPNVIRGSWIVWLANYLDDQQLYVEMDGAPGK